MLITTKTVAEELERFLIPMLDKVNKGGGNGNHPESPLRCALFSRWGARFPLRTASWVRLPPWLGRPHPSLSHSLRSQERVSYAALAYRGQPEQCSRLGEDETLRKRGSYKEEHPFFGTEKTEIQSEGFDQLTMASTSPSPASAASGRG